MEFDENNRAERDPNAGKPFDDDEDEKDEEEKSSDKTEETWFSKKEKSSPKDEESEPEAPDEVDDFIDRLSADESFTVVEEYVGARTGEVRHEVEGAQPDSAEEAAALADAALLEEMRDRIADAGEATEEVLDAALNDVAEDLGVTAEEVEDVKVEQPEASEATTEENSDPEEVDETPTPPTPPTPPTQPMTPLTTPGGPNLPPPITPTPPAVGSPSPGVGNILPPIPGGSLNPNVPLPTPNQAPQQSSPDVIYWQRSRAGDLLLGGVIGYLIGRRRGRKKAEKRLLPIQEKLEAEVKILQNSVTEREAKIRKLAAEKIAKEPEQAPLIIRRIEKRVEQKQAARRVEHAEKIIERNQDVKIGKFTLPKGEILPERRKITPEVESGKRKAIEVMTVPELLEIAQKIEKDNISVAEIYQNNRLNEHGLRRVVIEFLRGKHYEKVLNVYLLPDAGEVLVANLSPEQAEVKEKNGRSEIIFKSRTQQASAFAQDGYRATAPTAEQNTENPMLKNTLPKQKRSILAGKAPLAGVAAGVLIALLAFIYILLK